ncbi:MAG: hypothetical protein ABII25_00160 [bacterium]
MNVFYCVFEAISEIIKRPLSFLLSLFVFIIPIYFLGVSFFLYREGGEVLKREKEKFGNFLVEADSETDIRFLQEQIKSLREVRGLEDTANSKSEGIVFSVDLNIDLNETLKVEEGKRVISDLKGVKFVEYQGNKIERMESKNLILSVSSLILGLIFSIFVIKYVRCAFKKASMQDNERIEVLELAGAKPFFIHSTFIVKGLLAGLGAVFVVILFLKISLERIFVYYLN